MSTNLSTVPTGQLAAVVAAAYATAPTAPVWDSPLYVAHVLEALDELRARLVRAA